jgi:hypothetical protein
MLHPAECSAGGVKAGSPWSPVQATLRGLGLGIVERPTSDRLWAQRSPRDDIVSERAAQKRFTMRTNRDDSNNRCSDDRK